MADFQPRVTAQYDCTIHIGPNGSDVVVVIDRDDGKPVTNGASAVVAEIPAAMNKLGERPLIYRDTMGRYDGLDHDERQFVGFYPVGGVDLADAIRRVDRLRLF